MRYGLFPPASRHKVFVSYHHLPDQYYRDKFEKFFSLQYDVMISKSVQIGDIDPGLATDTIRDKIRDEYLRDSTVTVVLIGEKTWQRKHVDWEISSSIRKTKNSSRSGLLGIILPTYQMIDENTYNIYTIPPRLHYNIKCGYALIYKWNEDPKNIKQWIHEAYIRKDKVDPDNSYQSFVYNKSGDRWV
ncbi:MAG TPA: hypothetical protein DDZ34_02150 [Syntrophaceae bacterium]|nr:hypothetical protein [Syntrophaceae bacterium]